ncbi:MAG TPA: hypothetical protein PKE41_10780 [Candidatus Macondimonas sp.]|nr:hypothetical protein [Candidatus Macondimonas sp.]
MNPRSALLSLAGFLTVPFSVSAALSEMTEAELSTVSGQAYVVTFGRIEAPIADLTERNLALGPIDVSGKAHDIESDYPLLTGLARKSVVTTTNTALVAGKTTVIAGVATVPGVGMVIAPLLSLTPTPQVRFE